MVIVCDMNTILKYYASSVGKGKSAVGAILFVKNDMNVWIKFKLYKITILW